MAADGPGWREQGIAAAHAGDRAGAEAALQRAVQANPADEEAWFWLAAVQIDPRWQLAALERVLRLNPRHPQALAGQAAVRAQLGLAAAPPAPPAAPPAPPARGSPAAATPPANPFGDSASAPFSGPAPAPAPFPPPAAAPFSPPPLAPSPFMIPAPRPGPVTGEVAPSPFGAAPAPAAPSPFGVAPAPAAPSPFGDDTEAEAGAAHVDALARQGIAAAQAGRRAEAREALLAVVEYEEQNEAVWYWLSTVLDDPADIEVALENTLHLNPDNAAAAQALQDLRRQDAPPSPPDQPPPPLPPPMPVIARQAPERGTPLAWSEVPVALSPADVPGNAGSEYEDLVGQVMGGRYRVVALFPGQGRMLLLAADIRNGTYLLLRPEDTLSAGDQKGVTRGFEYRGKRYSITNIGLAGISLRNFMGTIGRMPPAQAVEYGLRLIREAGRSRHLLLERRAWQPEKMMLNQDGALDLTAPIPPPDDPPGPSSLSPPEHAAGGPLDVRSDVYLIGALMYYLLTTNPPPSYERVPAPSPDATAAGHGRGKPRPVAQFQDAPWLPPFLAGALATTLQPDPAARYPSLAALQEVLLQLQAELRQVARSRGLRNPFMRILLSVAGGSALLLLLLLVAGIWVNRPPAPTAERAGGRPLINSGFLGTPGVETAGRGGSGLSLPSPTPSIFATDGISNIKRLTITGVDARRPPTFTLYLSVVSGDDKPVGGLTRADFALTSDGVAVPDFRVENMSVLTAPLSTYLVLDAGAGIRGPPLQEAQAAVRKFVALLAPDTRLALIAARDRPQLLQDLTVSPTLVLSAVDSLDGTGNVALYAALDLAATAAARQEGRTAIVLLSTGHDTTGPGAARDGVVQFCKQHGIPVYIAGWQTEPGYDRLMLQDLAVQTGGAFLESPDPTRLTDLYQYLAYQIKGQYRIAGTAASAPGNHDLRVTLHARDKTYTADSTYLSPGPP